jgi:20S proteasome alpha/beta subunit
MVSRSNNEQSAPLPLTGHCPSPKPLPSYLERLGTRPQKPYIRRIKRERKAMTIVVGFRCANGIVLGADRQISVPGAHKYHERKIRVERGDGWNILFGYAGLPGVAREAKLHEQNEPSIENLKKAVDSVVTDMSLGRQYGDSQLELLIGWTAVFEKPELLKFDGKGLHTADDFNVLGVGESSLIRFLADNLFQSRLNVEFGATVAAYLIYKAGQYVDHCGGPIDVITMTDFDEDYTSLSESDIQEMIAGFKENEERLVEVLIHPFASPT